MAVLLSGTFSTVGTSAGVAVQGAANITLKFTGRAKVSFQRSFDGTTWQTLSRDITGDLTEYNHDFNTVFDEPEAGVQYRFNCIEHETGTITYRIGQ